MQFLKEDKLRSTVRRLELHKHDHVYSRSNKFCIFHLEKMLVWLLTRLVFSLTCDLMIGMIFSRNLARQGYWCNHLARRINKKRISLMCIDSLSVWKPWFLVFVEFVRANYCGACKKTTIICVWSMLKTSMIERIQHLIFAYYLITLRMKRTTKAQDQDSKARMLNSGKMRTQIKG